MSSTIWTTQTTSRDKCEIKHYIQERGVSETKDKDLLHPDTWAHPLPDNNLVTTRKAESCDAIQTACPPWPKDVACGVALSISHSLDSSTQTVIGR